MARLRNPLVRRRPHRGKLKVRSADEPRTPGTSVVQISIAQTMTARTVAVRLLHAARYLTALCVAAVAGAAVAVAVLPAGTAHAASDYPNRPIQLIVPYAPGGVTDQVARIVAQGMENKFGQRVLVVNRAGASTVLGT